MAPVAAAGGLLALAGAGLLACVVGTLVVEGYRTKKFHQTSHLHSEQSHNFSPNSLLCLTFSAKNVSTDELVDELLNRLMVFYSAKLVVRALSKRLSLNTIQLAEFLIYTAKHWRKKLVAMVTSTDWLLLQLLNLALLRASFIC